MKEPKWTPWEYNGGGIIVGRGGHQIACLSGLMNNGNADISGNLMAASPNLYKALEDVKATLEEAAKILAKDHPALANNIVNQCAIRCGDVLAKARGEKGEE
jgi:predicted dehydrogenase